MVPYNNAVYYPQKLLTDNFINLNTDIIKHMKASFITTINRAAILGITAVAGFAILFGILEPQITHSQVDTSEFIIRQTITAESSFLVEPADVTMNGSINGVTGGQATGTTQFVVQTNNGSGYYVDISFFNNGTNEAMVGDVTASEAIRDYGGDVVGEPSFGYTASTAAQLAYTVMSSSTLDTDASFRDTGAACGAGANEGNCWKAPEVSAFRIVERGSSAITGATSSVQFNVSVPSGATPVPSAETYTATATLSLYNL